MSITTDLQGELAADRADAGSRIWDVINGAAGDPPAKLTAEQRAVLHTALRAPRGTTVMVDGVDVIPGVHEVLDRMAVFAEQVYSIWTWYTPWAVLEDADVHGILGPPLPGDQPSEPERLLVKGRERGGVDRRDAVLHPFDLGPQDRQGSS